MKERTLADLNQTILGRKPEWVQGVLDAANMVDSMYERSQNHSHMMGDCVLAKLNLLKRRIRRNPHYKNPALVVKEPASKGGSF